MLSWAWKTLYNLGPDYKITFTVITISVWCDAGRYNDSATTCSDCLAGTYKSTEGNTGCLDCPAGNTSLQNGSTNCPDGKNL